MSTTKNASGLTPAESKALQTREPNDSETAIIDALHQLYRCKPKSSSYHIYDNNAIFHDPIGIAKGVDSIQAQFDGLAKMFPRADIPKFRILKNPSFLTDSTLLIDQDVAYYRQADASEPTKTVNSLLTIERSNTGLITKHTEEWNHEHESSAADGTFIGKINEWRKVATATLTDKVVGKSSSADSHA
ncbi:hypothetical protein DL93DRAFT_2050373 [Clavulina sp. PMI_390]|nr:hypothetical protein DL93DRAFT_2050373 [Clavulina sp. PMI_390]